MEYSKKEQDAYFAQRVKLFHETVDEMGLNTKKFSDAYHFFATLRSIEEAKKTLRLLADFFQKISFPEDPVLTFGQYKRIYSNVEIDTQIAWRGKNTRYTHILEVARTGSFKKDGRSLFNELAGIVADEIVERMKEAELDMEPSPIYTSMHRVQPLRLILIGIVGEFLPSKKSKWSRQIWDHATTALNDEDAFYENVFRTYTEGQQRTLLKKLLIKLDLPKDELEKIVAEVRVERVHKS